MPTPNNDAAIEFLTAFHPHEKWVLTAIDIDKKGITTTTFEPDQVNRVLAWLEEYNGKRNIYFHVNPVLRDLRKKAERQDIKEVQYLHVDLDPRAGEDLTRERNRVYRKLRDNSKFAPKPTFIVFSGGGFQGFWKLKEPIPINGDLARAEDAKRYNQQLELLFGADNCHNIDRLMRLPGTINLPDARKRKKGREPELAKVVDHWPDAIYSIGEFTPADTVQSGDDGMKGTPSGQAKINLSGNIARLDDVNDLDEWSVPDRVKVIVVQGDHPDEPKEGDNSRSAWLFDCLCQLVRCNVPDDVIFSVITDPNFGISASVLDKGANIEKYAIRQIERAKEEAVDPWLRQLNESHAVISNFGGKCRIVEEIWDPAMRRSRLTKQTFDDFKNRYMNQKIKIGTNKEGDPVMMPVGKWWLEHPMRRQYKTIVFAPGQTVPDSYNLWRGFAYTAAQGQRHMKFLQHIKDNICCGHEEHYEYLIRWMARVAQQPDTQGQVAVVLRGNQGTGKGFFAKTLGELFGRHFLQVSNPHHLVGNFNSHLRDCVLLFGDEAFFAGDKRHESVLKTLITEELMMAESKGVDAEASPNFTHTILASNSSWVVPAGADERRYFVLDVSDGAKQNAAYFRKIRSQLEQGGYENILWFLLNLDLTDFEVRAVPKTEALREQKLMSMSPDEEWWYRKLIHGQMFGHDQEWPKQVVKERVFRDYIHCMQMGNIHMRRSTETVLGRFMRRMCPGLRIARRHHEEDEVQEGGWKKKVSRLAYFYLLPSLEECRKAWEGRFGDTDWEEAIHDAPEPDPLPLNEPF